MKNRLFAVVAIAAVLFTVSCKSGGMSEETKTKMNNFETDWNAMKQTMSDFESTMNTRMDAMNKKMHESMPMEDGKDMKGDMKMDHMDMMSGDDSMTMMCNMIMMEMESMKTNYKTAMDTVKAQSDQYDAWKKDMMDAKDEDATLKGLEEWNAKLAANKAMIDDWNDQLTQMEKNCDNVCMMMMEDMKDTKKK